jgi:hypothetical protein
VLNLLTAPQVLPAFKAGTNIVGFKMSVVRVSSAMLHSGVLLSLCRRQLRQYEWVRTRSCTALRMRYVLLLYKCSQVPVYE